MTGLLGKNRRLHAPTKKELVRRARRSHAQDIRADVRDGVRIRALHHGAAAVTTPALLNPEKDDALQLLRAASLQRFRVLLTSSAPPPS